MEKIFINQKDFSGSPELEKISALLNGGKVGVIPTATIYGLSCRYDDEKAVEKIYMIKKRKAGTPFIILISSISQLGSLTGKISIRVQRLIDRFWNIEDPQPLTLVFSKSESVGNFLTGGRETIAVRMAGLKAVRDIIDLTGPIVSTSATVSGTMVQPKTLAEVPGEIKQKADFVVDYGESLGGKESTIVDITSKESSLLRKGALEYEDIFGSLDDY